MFNLVVLMTICVYLRERDRQRETEKRQSLHKQITTTTNKNQVLVQI